MIELFDGILLYHGSYTSVPHIDLGRCASGLDFGQGFYLTTSYEQARDYVPMSVHKAGKSGTIASAFNVDDGQISVYRFHYDPNLLIHQFQTANIEWLHYVAANRNPSLFPLLLKKYRSVDIIGGKIADDRTAITLQLYVTGQLLAPPGDPETDKAAIAKLLPNRLQDQLCFRTADAIDALEFVRSDRYGDIKK